MKDSTVWHLGETQGDRLQAIILKETAGAPRYGYPACELTDGVFAAFNAARRLSEGRGNFKTDGTTITYYDFISFIDEGEGGGKHADPSPPNAQLTIAIDENRMPSSGQLYLRFPTSRVC